MSDQTEAELEKTRSVVRENIAAQQAEIDANPAYAALAESEEAGEVPEGWDAYTVEELKDELRNRDLAVSGTKDELVARLNDSDAEEG